MVFWVFFFLDQVLELKLSSYKDKGYVKKYDFYLGHNIYSCFSSLILM